MKLRFHDRIQEGDFTGRIPKNQRNLVSTSGSQGDARI